MTSRHRQPPCHFIHISVGTLHIQELMGYAIWAITTHISSIPSFLTPSSSLACGLPPCLAARTSTLAAALNLGGNWWWMWGPQEGRSSASLTVWLLHRLEGDCSQGDDLSTISPHLWPKTTTERLIIGPGEHKKGLRNCLHLEVLVDFMVLWTVESSPDQNQGMEMTKIRARVAVRREISVSMAMHVHNALS